jgi:tRNA G18 (ribose-2'-O)-methylase SpoU
MKKLKPEILRKSDPTPQDLAQIKRNPIYLVLDQILDTFNVGSLFRLADAIAAEKMYLCGNMEYPPNSRVHKAAVGTENWVPWEKSDSTLQTIKMLKDKGVHTIAVEQSEKAIPYKKLHLSSWSEQKRTIGSFSFPVAIIAGHETEGLSKEILKEVDQIVELPMYGINHSFNVWGTTAIVAYKLLENI